MIKKTSPHTFCHFAVKSLDHLAALSILKDTGIGLDIVSQGELARALHIGFDPQKIVFSGVGKTDSELAFALEQKIAQINVETLGELERLNKIALEKNCTAPIAIRINPELGYGGCDKITTGNKSDKFGIPWREISNLWPDISQNMAGIKLQGIAVHGGSQILDENKFRHLYQHTAQLVREWQKDGIKIDSLDCGGGFGIPYSFEEQEISLEKIQEIITEILVPLGMLLRFEPGRYISGPSGILLSRVTEIKETDSHKFLILDTSMNDLLRPALYNAAHEIIPLEIRNENQPLESYDIVGPICESSDFFRRSYIMPRLKRGDLVAILDTGAYGSVMSSSYNSHPLAPIALTSKGKWEAIRKRQTVEEILSTETLPQWL
ncbi:diaminopimelate decarboxylase [Lasius niger]|uniref:Diaminopimelate decarboxylase n=1 Tax=Lasius niger TaxID=67767 RepID=A0A0J7K9S2_LASNI|nr:diaminopimelate decarboxylase [Lasius niger]